jgi:hypothetical protein
MNEAYYQDTLRRNKLTPFLLPESDTKAGKWLQDLNLAYQIRLEALLSVYKGGAQRPARFTFVVDTSLNACADIYKQQGFVSINSGSIYILMDFFHALFALPSFLSHVGTISPTDKPFERIEVSYSGIVVDPNHTPSRVDVPRYVAASSIRQHYASVLVQLTLDFIFAHEAIHVLAGHPIYRQTVNMNSVMFARPVKNEGFSPTRKINQYIYESKALELDADLEAARRLVHYLIQGSSMVLSEKALPEKLYDRFLAFCLSVASYFCIVAPESYGRNYMSTTHPHPYVRLAYVFSGVADYLETREDKSLLETWKEASYDSINVMESAWESIGMSQLQLKDYFTDQSQIEDEVSAIHSIWRSLLPILEPYDCRQSELA